MIMKQIIMNTTSFSTSCEAERMANIDSSSTAHLTMNAAGSSCISGTSSRSNRGSNNSDSDLETSPSSVVQIVQPTGNFNKLHNHQNHNHQHSHLNNNHNSASHNHNQNKYRISKCEKSGSKQSFAMFWYKSSVLEKILILFAITTTLSLLLLISSVNILIKEKRDLQIWQLNNNQNATSIRNQPQTIFNHDCSSAQSNPKHLQWANRSYCLTPDCVKVAASVIEAIDNTVHPCDDFYMYSCGDWIKSNPLPDGKSNWGTFSKLWQDNQAIMRSVLESSNFTKGSAEGKAKIYYEACLDRNDIVEARGTKPVEELLDSAGGWSVGGNFDSSAWNLQDTLQIYHNQYNRGGLFSWSVGADERNSTRNIIQLDQGGLGLPSRDYYLNKTDKVVLDAYLLYMVKVGELMANGTNGNEPAEDMKEVLEFERRLAEITVPQDQRRDDERLYHKFTLRELSQKAPFLNWTKYFDDAFDYHSKTTISFSSKIKPRSIHIDKSHDKQNETTINESDATSKQLKDNKNSKRHRNPEYSITNTQDYVISAAEQETNNNNTPGDKNSRQNQQATLDARNPNAASNYVDGDNHESNGVIKRHRITENEQVVIYSPEFFEELSKLIQEYEQTERGKRTIANYMAWSVIQSLVATLPKSFRDASRPLRKALIGSEGIEVSWRYCVSETNTVMGFALGSLFVRRVFQGKSKERAEEMIFNIRNAFKDNLANLAWMDDRTRQLATEKADHINQMIGFPDFILSPQILNEKYEGLELDEDSYFENNIKVNVLALRENMEKINKPANKTEWEMTPPMVNAYYTPTKNQIVFPAGILQTPFYDLSFPNSLNYGAMGVVMGHELTHAFDDQGREYDKDGNLYKWWHNETLQNFEERVKCFVNQYSSYKIDDNYLNGRQTLGENIADNGGLKAAFRAYEKWSERNPEPYLPGLNLTSKQLFFVGFAQVWCSINTPEAQKLQVLNDAHAPAQFRVVGTLSNSEEFAREFNCPIGSKMNPEKKCIVW